MSNTEELGMGNVELKPGQVPTQDWHDPDGDGLVAAMARAFDNKLETEVKPEPQKEVVIPEKKEVTTEVVAPEKVSTAPDKKDIIEIKEDFFGEQEEKPLAATKTEKEKEFDPSAFDSETELLAKGMDPKAHVKFKELREQLKSYKQNPIPADYQKQLDDLKAAAQERDGLKERLKEVSAISAQTLIQTRPEYDAQIIKPAAQVMDEIAQLAVDNQIDPELMKAIARKTDRVEQNKLIEQHLGKLSTYDQHEFFRMIGTFGSILRDRQKMLSNAEQEIQSMEAKRIENQNKVLSEQRKIVVNQTAKHYDEYAPAIPGMLDENGDPTPELAKLKSRAMSIDFSQAKASDMAFAAFAGTIVGPLVKKVQELQLLVKQYEETDARRTGKKAAPSSIIGGKQGDSEPATGESGLLGDFLAKKF